VPTIWQFPVTPLAKLAAIPQSLRHPASACVDTIVTGIIARLSPTVATPAIYTTRKSTANGGMASLSPENDGVLRVQYLLLPSTCPLGYG